MKRELLEPKSGTSTIAAGFSAAIGERAEFDLVKVRNFETIYHITARGDGFRQSYRIRVFGADEVSSFIHKSGSTPDVRTYIFVPKTLNPDTGIVVVMHGLSRNADDYIASWQQWAGKSDNIVVAPNFDNENWKGSRSYNLGNILTSTGLKQQRSKWSFEVVQEIFAEVRYGFGLNKNYFDLFGHSAGGQFVHRFMLFMPRAKVRLAIAANSGWYTLPDLNLEFPYGLRHMHLAFTNDDLLNWSARNVFILRGTDDTARESNLRQTPEADSQGRNRFERAGYMFKKIKAINPETNWRLIDVPRVAHDQKRMAVAAQSVIETQNKR